jgi:hypothetical protein
MSTPELDHVVGSQTLFSMTQFHGISYTIARFRFRGGGY